MHFRQHRFGRGVWQCADAGVVRKSLGVIRPALGRLVAIADDRVANFLELLRGQSALAIMLVVMAALYDVRLKHHIAKLSWLRSRGSTKGPASRLTCIGKVHAVSGKDQLLDLAVLSGAPCRMTLQAASHSTKALRMLPNAAKTETMATWWTVSKLRQWGNHSKGLWFLKPGSANFLVPRSTAAPHGNRVPVGGGGGLT